MRSLEKNNFEVKKYQMLNYIAELQREKIIPLNEVTKELIVLTQYENGYFQTSEFQHIAEQLIGELKGNIRSIYERKYEFIRQPEQICVREEEPILNGIYEEQQQQPFVNNPYSFQDRKIQSAIVSKLDDFKVLGVSPEEQNICLDWVENLTLEQIGTVKSQSEGIILCSLEVSKNIIAIGSKDGQINIYETSSGKKIANLRGHKASICKLALIVNNGKKYLASGSDHGCSSIVLWDITTWNMRMRIESHKAAVTAIVDLQDNRSMVSGSYDKTINVYNLNSEGKILYNLPVNKTSVTGILLNCTGSKMISCGLDDTLNVWQIVRGPNRLVETMFLERIIQNNTTICSLIASTIKPDIVLLGAKDGKIKLINTDRGEAYKTINSCNNAVIEMAVIERKSKPGTQFLT
jgi:WD40 repeat protein